MKNKKNKTKTIKKDTLVIMGTHWKGFKYFDWKRTDCDIWMFNEAPNVKLNGKEFYPTPPDEVFKHVTLAFYVKEDSIIQQSTDRKDFCRAATASSGSHEPRCGDIS